MSGKKRKSPPKRGKAKRGFGRRLALRIGLIAVPLAIAFAAAGDWFACHPEAWLAEARESWPGFVTAPLTWIGDPCRDLTDSLGWTGHDCVYEYDEPAPAGEIAFAGLPRRTGDPAPTDITVLDRGEFKIGWSPSLHRPVWCAYHLTPEARFECGKRPNFQRDKTAAGAPAASAYEHTTYDRGHMVPNYGIATRYGEAVQKLTFLTSNIAPQSPALNRGVWREVEHRIAELWTAKYGELWIIVGAIPSPRGDDKLPGGEIDIPQRYYQIVVAEDRDQNVRALAVEYPQSVRWRAYPFHGIVSIDEIERRTGLEFFPDLPNFIRDPLEAETPTRLWPIRWQDIFRQIAIRVE